ncbi:MAG: DUF5119 domain-containing protein [Muribaculaceae bacterium]|nr:DUF5119 domain-containing protein [Muribaculaceae bacterium]
MTDIRYYIQAVMLAVLPLLSSCRQELCYNHFPSADIVLSWEQEWERDYGMNHVVNWDAGLHGFGYESMRPDLPEWVDLVKFRHDGTSEDNFLNIKGGNISIDNTTDKSFLLYNGDTEYIVLEDMASLNDARATTTSRSRSRSALQYLQSITPEARTVNPPDLLYGAYVEELPQVYAHQNHHMPVTMQPLVYTYIIRYEFEHGLEHVALARGAMGGMAESVYLRNGVTSDNSAILLYDCSLTDYGCEAHVRTFGVPSFPDEYYGKAGRPRNVPPVSINLEMRLTNGNYIEFNYDVTDQIDKQPRGGVIYIRNIRIEDEQNIGSGGGFDVDLSGWGDPVNIELPLK